MEIGTLIKELERQKETSLDLIVDSRNLKAAPDGETVVELEIPEHGKFPLTTWAHLQMAEKLGIPKRYYDRMITAGKAELLADNINAWLGEKDRRLVRVLDRQIRAVLSDRYRIMDNYDLLYLSMEEFRKKETVEIYKAEVTETMLYLKAIDRTLTAEITRGDMIYGGLIIRNSEVGASAFRVETFILRKICSNGLIGEHSLKKVHLGHQTMEIGEIDWSDETRALEDKALWAKARDIIRLTFDSSIFSSWVKKMRESTEIAIEKPIKAINNVARLASLSEEQRDDLLAYFSEHTKYGLINAVTSLARETKNADEQIRLEGFGGKLLNTPDKEFEKLIAQEG